MSARLFPTPQSARGPGLRRAARILSAAWVGFLGFLAVKQLARPEKSSVYPEYAQTARDLAAGVPPSTCVGAQYLPYFGDLVYPAAVFPDRFGGLLWVGASVAILLTGVRAFVRRFAAPADEFRTLVWVYGVTAALGLGSLANGQANVFIAGCLLWGTAMAADRRWWAAAAWLAAPGFKLYPLALGMVYATLHPRTFAPRFAVTVGVCLTLPFALHPADLVASRYRDMADFLTSGRNVTMFQLMNVRDTLAAYGFTALTPRFFVPVQVLTGAAIVLTLRLVRHRGHGDDVLVLNGFLLTSLWFVTFGPSVEWQTFALAGVAVGWATAEAWRSGRSSATGLGLLAATVFVGPLHNALFGTGLQRAVVGSMAGCWVLVALFVRQLWMALATEPATVAIPITAAPDRVAA